MKNINLKQNDIDHLYKRLPLYRSVLFKKCTFKIESESDDLKSIEGALNIKDKKKRLEYIYDEACRILDERSLSVGNPCGFKCSKCYAQRTMKSDNTNGCCRLCRFQSSKGCTTKKVVCKLYFCDEVKKRHDVLEFKDVAILKVLNKKQRAIIKSDYFSSREEVLSDLSSLSMTFAIAKIFKRISKFYFKEKGKQNEKNF